MFPLVPIGLALAGQQLSMETMFLMSLGMPSSQGQPDAPPQWGP